MIRRFVSSIAVLFVLSLGLAPVAVHAQGASPAASPAAAPSAGDVIASGLTNPRGFTWGADGTLYVALAGFGGTNPATETAPTTNAIGPFLGGPSASIARIENGCPVTIAGGLPSTLSGIGEVLGADDVAILGDQLYASVDGGGPVHGNENAPSGIYRILADGTTELVADLSAWVRANPVATLPPDLDPDAAGFSVVADESAGLLWVVDPNSGQILTVTPDGVITRVADLSAGHPVPTKLALDPNGGVYAGTLTALPYADGAAKVMHVAADGTVTDVWTGLTAVTSVAVGPDGTLYATEMSTGNLDKEPFVVPGSGKVVHQTGPATSEDVASGLMLPVALRFGPDGGLYVAMPAFGANNGEGTIIRLEGFGTTPAASATPAACPAPMATPVAATPAAE